MILAEQTRTRGRPRKGSDTTNPTREALLRAGLVALTIKGFSSTGIEEILIEVGVPKGSFYHYFSSKEAYGLELIECYSEYFARKLDRFLLNVARSPLDRLRDFTVDAEKGMQRYDYKRGCLIGNLGQEMGSLPETFRGRLISVFDDWERRVAVCLREAQKSRQISGRLDCDHLATLFWIGWEGAILRTKLQIDPAPLRVFADAFFATLMV